MVAPSPGHGSGSLYRMYGLTVASDLLCPHALPGRGTPDVAFREGAVPETLPDAVDGGVCYETAPGRALVSVRSIGRFLVAHGREITFTRAPGADDASVRLLLLGTCLGVLLHQRGGLVLHATTVVRGGTAIALAGPSSVGKSTLAAAFLQRGYSLVADEITLVDPAGDGTALVVPGGPSMLLWRNALERLGLWTNTLAVARPGLEKYVLPVGDAFAAAPARLSHLVQLSVWTRSEVAMEPLSGFTRFRSFLDNGFKEPYLFGMGLNHSRQRLCGAVVPTVSASRLTWSRSWADLDGAADLVEEAVFLGRQSSSALGQSERRGHVG